MHRLLRNGCFVTCDSRLGILRGDLRIRDGKIAEIGEGLAPEDAEVVELNQAWVTPGFTQSHVHLCQTLFRGQAEDRVLLDWLSERIWPLESAHDAESMYWSARLGVSELLLGGTTSLLDMGTLHHTDVLFQVCEEAGIRAAIGRALMDRENDAGLSMPREENLQGACDEADRWHGKGRLRYAFAPRFVPSCTEELLLDALDAARERGCLIHTHASENEAELELVRDMTGQENVVYLHSIGMTGPDVCLAHCIHLSEEEVGLLAATGTHLLHCPSSNMKLGSGVARIPELLQARVRVSLGADGAPCNNRLDMFTEMRLAALLQAQRAGPGALSAEEVLHMATVAGAEAVGLGATCGSLAPGKVADLVVVDPDHPGVAPQEDPVVAMVFSVGRDAVSSVWIAGEKVVENGRVLCWDGGETAREARLALKRVQGRLS
jgi:cytosine/adenosine deaminase-related metal-dependent hydrolase